MHKPVQRIGRTMGQTAIANFIDSNNASRTFTLKSGKSATFTRQLIPHGDIASRTYVDTRINGRDQATLTEESVRDITRTIGLQQFFPAIGRQKDNRVEIMDGSRRRAACLFAGASLEVLVTNDELDISDARQLAADIQTAKEHNLRELGLRFTLMNQNGMSKSDIAKVEGISNAKVTRAFQAASVPAELIALFPVVSELTLPDYQLLLDVTDNARAESVAIGDVAEQVRKLIGEHPQQVNSADEQKNQILGHFRAAKRSLVPPKAKALVTEKLADFDDRNIQARRKVNAEKRAISYEFVRLPKDAVEQIEAAIKQVLTGVKGVKIK
ncbi:ParB/RepB/Spo0J family partition protein [Pantoea phytobeneficialis]|uniref:Chromosome partitioning protein ParB n=1 Tax=Pantoea phytobeneficialis TaxID=2052056 RepID=A0AAP9KS61_9GAMM|nr:ParB/RepB/Spo0J family partition protein [Pantoea phytobeneficialis]MDO6407429.1 ParB/RepB/Spo0J family partition protein [Pantoea phytobeneficialis]QGR09522.1 chromosome partitioning protein ParB [Pantoea phytobeneficialis]